MSGSVGARELFAARLIELHEAAGSPPLERVAARAMARRPRDARWRVTGKRISDWKLGNSVPASAEALNAVVRKLIELARAKDPRGQLTPGLYDEAHWQRWWAAARAEPLNSASTPSLHNDLVGEPIRDQDPIDLEVHAAIDSGAIAAGLDVLPTYIRREHDDWLAEIVTDAVGGRSKLAVLVGNSSTGKTRACWEAIQILPPEWRLWHPIQPSRPEAAVNALKKVGPRTVIWLNELNHYLLTPGSSQGEHVAAVLRELLRNANRKPVLILGTIWPEYWGILTAAPKAGTEDDPHAQARSLLIGSSKPVPEAFTGRSFIAARYAAGADPRLAEAFHNADHGQITQYLAGVPVLIERYRNAPAPARALIEAAMDARRLGHGVALPRGLLEAAAAIYLTDQQWDSLSEDWFNRALAYTAAYCRGVRGPLTSIRPRPNTPSGGETCYRLADYLVQLRRVTRDKFALPDDLWAIYAEHASKEDLGKLAVEADKREHHSDALLLWTAAADAGDTSAARQAALMLQRARRIDDALTWYQRAAEAGNADALGEAARMLDDSGRTDEAMVWYKRAADLGDTFSLRQAVHIMRDAGLTNDALTWLVVNR